jgi:hypothetical protein
MGSDQSWQRKERERERERERESWAVERVEEFIYGEKDGWQGRRG